MKLSKVFQFFCILVLMGCAPRNMKQPAETSTSESPSLASPPSRITPTRVATDTPVLPSPVVPTRIVTDTPAPVSKIISKKNLNQLALLHQWDVEGVYFYRSANFWFSDSNQFVVLNADGIQSFKVDDLTPAWFLKSFTLDFTINENDQVLINLRGLHIFDRQGVELQTIRPRYFCDVTERAAMFIVAIPGTNLVVTGVQDSYVDYDVSYSKARVLLWDTSKNSCSELIKFNGYFASLSASDDGRYISYVTVIETADTKKSITRIYDLNLRKEKCELTDGYNYIVRFTRQNLLAVYDSEKGTISLVTPDDCTIKTKFSVGTEVDVFAINPSGELLAGITDHVIGFWDIQTGKKLREIDSKGNKWVIGFSPNGQFLVTAKKGASLGDKDIVMLWGIPGK